MGRRWARPRGGGTLPASPPFTALALTVLCLKETGSCSSSASDDTSDSEELLLESLPASEDDGPPGPPGPFFLFFTFLFLPSPSLCPLEEADGTRAQPVYPSLPQNSGEPRHGASGGHPGSQQAPVRSDQPVPAPTAEPASRPPKPLSGSCRGLQAPPAREEAPELSGGW